MKVKKFLALVAIATTLTAHRAHGTGSDDDDFDRLDGKGKSQKKVNVIEWEGNLEVHVMPQGSLRGLALKLDKRDKTKPVMVIGYRFDNDPKEQLIRRAILGVEFREGFKAYKDLSADDYDKIVISNNTLPVTKTFVPYSLDPEPTELYPEGHPLNSKTQKEKAEKERPPSLQQIRESQKPSKSQSKENNTPRSFSDESDGSIQHFSF